MSIGKNGVPDPMKPNGLQQNHHQSNQSLGSNNQESIQEYSIRVPKNGRKKFNLMRFNGNHNIDFAKWNNVKMERENNMKEYKGLDEEQPKFGAGSEFGRDQREEARRKKLGFNARKYKPEDQPWLLKYGGKSGKKFKGIREGGVSENASYYVFTHAADGAIEAFPLQEWYNFTPIQTYKALSAEEAEQEFGKRNRVLNFFSLMMRKRLRGDEEIPGEEGADEAKTRKSGKSKEKELKISEMDEWMETSSDDDSDEDKDKKESDDEDKKDKKAAKGKENAKKKKKQRDTDAEAIEDSDDGDEEGRELDYISSSSESEVEAEKQLQGVSEEKALRKLLTSDEDSDEDENKSNKDDSNEDDEKDEEGKKTKDDKEEGGKKKKKLKKKDSKKKEKKKESSSDFSSDSDSDPEVAKKKKDAKKEEKKESESRSSSPVTNGGDKRKLNNAEQVPAKKAKLDLGGTSLPSYLGSSSDSAITEEAVRRYLMRKPMTTTELLQKFKTKKTGLNSEQLVNIMTQILKKINPVKQTIKGKMYLSIKQ